MSAALFNCSTRCIGIDNFSQFDTEGKNELISKKNFGKFNNPTNIEFYNQDYRIAIPDLFSKDPSLKINVCYYDGEHNYENQIEGLNIMLPHLAHKVIILVDDVNWGAVAKANKYFVKKNPDFKSIFKIRTKGTRSRDWWNGFEVIARDL